MSFVWHLNGSNKTQNKCGKCKDPEIPNVKNNVLDNLASVITYKGTLSLPRVGFMM